MCVEGGGGCQLGGNRPWNSPAFLMHIWTCRHEDFMIVPLTFILKGLRVPPPQLTVEVTVWSCLGTDRNWMHQGKVGSTRTKLSDLLVVAHRRQRLYKDRSKDFQWAAFGSRRELHIPVHFWETVPCLSRFAFCKQLWSSCDGTGGRSQEHLHASNLVDPAPGQGWRGMVNACEGE